MISSRLLAFALLACGACSDDVPTLDVMTTAHATTTLNPPDDHIPSDLGHYRWDLVEKPVGATSMSPFEAPLTSSITIIPPVRGIYVLDRWFVGEAADQLSYHVVVTAAGQTPAVVISGPARVGSGPWRASTEVPPPAPKVYL